MIVSEVLLRTTAAFVVVALAAGCGAKKPAVEDREWIANTRGVVEQLRGDVVSVSGFDRLAAAREGLRDESELYGLLVVYSDFGGCLHMAAAVGAEPPGRARVVELLHRACVRLQRADRLFSHAVAGGTPWLLVRATREALAAVPALDAAALALARRT
jgi:hypothetical protein